MVNQGGPAPANSDKFVDLVLSGGGVKGIAHVGALAVLEAHGFQVQNIAGTSAGAIVGSLYAAGYSAAELRGLVDEHIFPLLMDTTWESRIPIIGMPGHVLTEEGMYEGRVLYEKIRDLLAAKGVHTFRDLIYDPATPDLRYRYKVQVLASDLTARRLLFLPLDSREILGVEPDDLEVAYAVRMSASIPLFFDPMWHRNPGTGQEHLIVDGGVLSNYPVEFFDSADPPAWPTFGLQLVEADPNVSVAARIMPTPIPHGGVEGLIAYITSLVQTMLESHDRLYMDTEKFVRTITIPTLGLSTANFLLSAEDAQRLYDAGRAAAESFLATWDFAAYRAAFRSTPQDHSRRGMVAAELQRAAPPGPQP